jgi:hypothetical protein
MSGLQVKYSELFSLSTEQLFYANGICKAYLTDPLPDLQIIPTSESISLMSRLDFIFKTRPAQAGFIVLSRVTTNTAGDTLLRFPVKNTDKLSFWILLKNPDVFTFDNLPVENDPTRLYYFSNALSDAGAPRNNLHLSIASSVNGANDSIKKAGNEYHYHHNSTVAPGTAIVKHILSGLQVDPKMIVNQSGESDLHFDLSYVPSGKCKLLINSTEKDNFYNLGSSVSMPVFGVIDIMLSPLLEPNYRVVETGSVLTPARPFYKIRFNNRPTIWRYTITLEKNNPLYTAMRAMTPADRTDFIDHLKIITNDSAITFSRISATDTVFEFISDNPIPLQEKYVSSSLINKGLSLALKKNTGIAGEAVVRDYLPFPSTGLIDAHADPIIYSDIFLTL